MIFTNYYAFKYLRMDKKGLPASVGLMAGSMFSGIVDYMTE